MVTALCLSFPQTSWCGEQLYPQLESGCCWAPSLAWVWVSVLILTPDRCP